MAIRPEPQKSHVEQRPCRVQALRAVEGFEFALISGRRLIWSDPFGWNRMDVGGGDRRMRQQRLAHHAIIAQRVIVRYEAFVTPEPMRARPRKMIAIGRFSQELI